MKIGMHKSKTIIEFCCSVETQKGTDSKFGWTNACLYRMTAKQILSNKALSKYSVRNCVRQAFRKLVRKSTLSRFAPVKFPQWNL